jgi:hypothetical protein
MPEPVTAWLISAGPIGVFCLYLIWWQQRQDKVSLTERKERIEVDRDRIQTDKALAASLATLATMVQGWPR